MSSSTREIKQRMSNIRSVEQIIKAMDMVSSTKLVRARQSLEGVRPMHDNLNRMVKELSQEPENTDLDYFNHRKEVQNSLYIIFTSDQGLAGSYNTNILKRSLKHIEEHDTHEHIIIIGATGIEYLNKEDKNVIRQVFDVSRENEYYGAENIAQQALELYMSGEVDEVFVAFTYFENVLNLKPRIEKILPVDMGDTKPYSLNQYEPTIDAFIDELMPLFLHLSVFRAFAESHTSEQAARSVSMDAAGNNAQDLVEDLNREFNRKRQAAITQELTEITSSVQSMKKER